MTRIAKPRSSRWWNKQEQQLRNFITDNPDIEDMTCADVARQICSLPQAECAAMCRLLGVRLAD